ncbi:MAG: nitrite reductase large subunit NirB [Burkholderiaceae bacterium]
MYETSRKPQKLVVIGNGMAGMRTVEELLKIAPGLYEITVFGAEPQPNYNRILLSPVLAGEQAFADTVINDWDWYRDHGIRLRAGVKVERIDRARRVVIGADGSEAAYDRLLIATGSNPFMPPLPGIDLPGVIAYRDIADTEAMIDAAQSHQHAVVVGGGLLGLEAANGLRLRGMAVTVIHLMPWLMERQLDRTAGAMLRASLEDKGLNVLLETSTLEFVAGESGRVCAIKHRPANEPDATPQTTAAELVVVAIGIRPNTALAQAAGLQIDRGIVVTDTLQTVTDPRIYALGECVAHRGQCYGLVAPLFEMAKVCATHLAENGLGRFKGAVVSTKLKVTGVDVFSIGDFQGGPEADEILLSDPTRGVYKKLVLQNDAVIGACLVGDTEHASWYTRLVKDRVPVAQSRATLLFGENHLGDAGHAGASSAITLADDAEVCGCNGVCKKTICEAIKSKGLMTLDEVRKHTKASSSCGSCTGLVEQILAVTVGAGYSATPKTKPVCGCTDRTHAEVRAAIRDLHLLTVADTLATLAWRNPTGCASCRPAINYYLISTWPGEAIDDPRSRFVNERAHANIQKDGTFSVVPRMWGGMTSSTELRRIADVVDEFAIPTVKVTGGQRIDLLGVKKEDLPAVWKALDMPSGHAYGKTLRTVKTCVGSEWCRFGTQDSTRMGIELEQALWKMYAPHKVKLAVSGCPRNCAECGIKDVGVIGVDSGWEIQVAGNGGIKTEAGQFLVKVKTHEEVIEYAAAFLQLYREEGWYLERTVHYVDRVGLDHVKKRIVDDTPGRAALAARMAHALALESDPWHEPAKAQVDPRQFVALTVEV